MTASAMTVSSPDSLALLMGVLSAVLLVAVYVWLALALSAMFRKFGEETWKAWVPLYNQATVLRWGGFSPWLILLVLIPGFGALAVLVLLIIAAHRINRGFGYGAGLTVLAAFFFIIWASIVGFGPAVWDGPAPEAAPPGPVRRGENEGERAAVVEIPAAAPESSLIIPSASPAGGALASTPGTASPTAPQAWAPPADPIPADSIPDVPVATPVATPVVEAPATEDDPSPAPAPALTGDPRVGEWSSEIDDVSAISPSPFPPSAAGPASRFVPPVEEGGVISFVPGRRSAVTREPAAPRAHDGFDPDTFPELSGEVSAVVGSPAAGGPRSAASSVAAQQRRASEISDVGGEDDEATVIVRRKQVTWQLVPASGAPLALSGDVVVLGRNPAADPGHPSAQLVSVPDETRTVSKTHARLERHGDRWLITDLGSTNGVLVRTLMGEEVDIEPGTELAAGERFFLGDAEFQLQHLAG